MDSDSELKIVSSRWAGLRPALADILSALFLTAFVIVRYKPVLENFWLEDDPRILQHAVSHRPWEYFFVPGVWRELSLVNFMPWLTFTYDIDLKLFGLNPYGFYLHQLISLSVLAIVAYAVLRIWFSAVLSFGGVLLFITSVPFAETAQFLMCRHYFEGMIFALLTVYLFSKALRTNKKLLFIMAASFYLLACSANPIYVPMIFLLILLPEGNWSYKLRCTLPFIGMAAIYTLWRSFMLGMSWQYSNRLCNFAV